MFNPFRKKSFLEKCSDSVLDGLAAVGDIVVTTGEVIGDAVDALTTPSSPKVVIYHERPVIEERKVVIKTTTVTPSTSWMERETLRLQQENLRIRQENLRMERELANRRRRETAYEASKDRIARAIEASRNAVRVVLDEVVTSKKGNKYRVQLVLKGDEYKVLVKIYDLGIPVWESTFYDAKSAYDAFSSHRIIIKTIK